MAGHAQSLSLLCRIGGVKLSKAKQSTSYAVDYGHASGIQKAFGVHVGNDQLDVHPKRMCSLCYKIVCRCLNHVNSSEYERCGGGCGSPVQWHPHDYVDEDIKTCQACATVSESKTPGRPKKKDRRGAQPKSRSESASATPRPGQCAHDSIGTHSTTASQKDPDHTCTHTQSQAAQKENAGQDITKEQLIAVATPIYSTGQELSPSRFIQQLSAITCSICKHIINKAVEAKCCQDSFCTDCIWHWLGIKASCPVCRSAMSASQLVLPSVCCQSVLAEIMYTL